MAVLGYRSADLSAKVLGVLMLLEFAVLIVFDLAVACPQGCGALPLAALSPHNVFSGSIGIALMFAFTSFVGFESGALYGEETANPERSIPKATYIAVVERRHLLLPDHVVHGRIVRRRPGARGRGGGEGQAETTSSATC